MRIALVCTGKADLAAARLASARTRGEVTLIAPHDVAARLGPNGTGALWARAGTLERVAPTWSLEPAVAAFQILSEQVRSAPFDEIRFEATGGAAWAVALEARQGGPRLAVRNVIEVSAGDEAIGAHLVLGDDIDARLRREAERQALRDADAVEGPEEVLAQLRNQGLSIASSASQPAWPEGASGPAVRVVVTYKDLGAFLPACLRSLREQTVPVAITVVNDGSTDEEAAILDEAARADPPLTVIHQENAGVAAARNRGLRECTEELVFFADADNVYQPRAIERLREALRRRRGADWAACALRKVDESGRLEVGRYGPIAGCVDALFLMNTAGDASSLHRREALLSVGGFDEDRAVQEDWDLWLRYAEANRWGVAVPEILFDYRVRSSSMLRTRSTLNATRIRLEILRRHGALLAPLSREVANLAAALHQSETDAAWGLGREAAASDVVRLTERAEALGEELEEVRALASLLRERLDREESARADETRTAARTTAALTAERDQARTELQRIRDRVFGFEAAAREAQERQRAAESRLAMLEETTGLKTAKQLLEELDPHKRAVLERGITRLLRWGTKVRRR
jgi:Glycosyl transferase family 2